MPHFEAGSSLVSPDSFAFVVVGGAILGIGAGIGIAEALVTILAGVFDPPPEHLAVPWAYLGVVAGIAILGLVLAALAAIRAARRPPLTVLRDL